MWFYSTTNKQTYKYIDKVAKGDKKIYAFIAQQKREVLPDAVSLLGYACDQA